MKLSIPVFLAILLLPVVGFSTHLRGGQIRVVLLNNSSLACRIELTVYTDTSSEIRFGEGTLDFGDGSTHTTPTIQSTQRPDIFVGLGMVTYSITHIYESPGNYVISYTEPNLTGGILNMSNSVETRFYMDTYIVLTQDGAFNSPDFLFEPIFICQSGIPYSFSAAAFDNYSPGDFFYKYSLVTNPPGVTNFRLPENLVINEDNGTITWDTELEGALIQGQIWIVVKVEKFSKDNDYLGYITRVMQIIVEDHDSNIDMTSSVSDSNNRVVVTEGEEKVVKIILSDETYPDDLHVDLFNIEALNSNVTLTQYDSVADRKFRVAKLSFKTTPDIISDLPYAVTLRGISEYRKDVSLLFMTKDVPLPPRPAIILGAGDMQTVNMKLKVYPNPFRSELYVDGAEATFIDCLGHVILRSQVQKGEPINTSSLPTGFYVLQVVSDDGTKQSIKLIRD